MRLASFVASTSHQAMANLRSKLGEEAVIVTTQTLENGDVRITGAVAEKDIDLADVLTPAEDHDGLEWLIGLGDFHEWPSTLCDLFQSSLNEMAIGDPKTTLMTLIRLVCHFDDLSRHNSQPLLFSGPPGSGKTTTIAKLAARRVLANQPVDVLTIDVGRAGAMEQLTTLLDPLGIQPKVVASLTDAKAVLATCSSDLVLIDSPSTNPFDSSDLGVLSKSIDHFDAELLLVLEAGRSPADSTEIGESYAALGAKRLAVTKLDVAKRLGGILAAAEAGLAFSGAGIGPTIGDGWRPLTADGLARLLLCRYDSAPIGSEHS